MEKSSFPSRVYEYPVAWPLPKDDGRSFRNKRWQERLKSMDILRLQLVESRKKEGAEKWIESSSATPSIRGIFRR